MVKVVFVIAPEGFKDIEYSAPKQILEKNNIQVITASLQKTARGFDGMSVDVDVLLDDIGTEYNGIVFIGGPGSKIYFNNTKALELVMKYNKEKKLVGAICIAPTILANAGILKGKKATIFSGFESYLKDAEYTGAKVEVDENIITASGPDTAEEFGKKLSEKLRGE